MLVVVEANTGRRVVRANQQGQRRDSVSTAQYQVHHTPTVGQLRQDCKDGRKLPLVVVTCSVSNARQDPLCDQRTRGELQVPKNNTCSPYKCPIYTPLHKVADTEERLGKTLIKTI